MDTPKMIQIAQAQRSQSGKSLSVLDRSEDRWYTTKCWDLEMMVGAVIYAQTSEKDWNGKPMYWINDFTLPEGAVQGVSVPAPPQVQQAPTPVNPAPPLMAPTTYAAPPPPSNIQLGPPTNSVLNPYNTVDRDASIVAQSLCKSITFSSDVAAFAAYVALYEAHLAWQRGGHIPAAAAAETPASSPEWFVVGHTDVDDIPF